MYSGNCVGERVPGDVGRREEVVLPGDRTLQVGVRQRIGVRQDTTDRIDPAGRDNISGKRRTHPVIAYQAPARRIVNSDLLATTIQRLGKIAVSLRLGWNGNHGRQVYVLQIA